MYVLLSANPNEMNYNTINTITIIPTDEALILNIYETLIELGISRIFNKSHECKQYNKEGT